jgi:hypothetical protein
LVCAGKSGNFFLDASCPAQYSSLLRLQELARPNL